MPEEEGIEPREEGGEHMPPEDRAEESAGDKRSRGIFTRRNLTIAAGILGLGVVLFALLAVVSYRTGVLDNYIKEQFTAKLAEMGIAFEAEEFRVTLSPLQLHLGNATFVNRTTGEKLFNIRQATIGLTIEDLYAWQLTRDITVNTTDINGAEVWITFDEQGRSNFANLQLVEEEGQRIEFNYDSTVFSLTDGIVHFADESRRINADARNVRLTIEPSEPAAAGEPRRYEVELVSTDSTFEYGDSVLQDIDVVGRAVADETGADIRELVLESPIGRTTLTGEVLEWQPFRYNFDAESTVDLAAASTIFPLGTALGGVGTFKGTVAGVGEDYQVEGNIVSDELTADGVTLRGVNIGGTVAGTNQNYEATGKAIAEMLTFGDFQIDFPRIAGNVRGTGTDFRWMGELEAAAARSGDTTITELFLSDAVAEYRDRQLTAEAGTARAQRFALGDNELTDAALGGLRLTQTEEGVNVTAETLRAGGLEAEGYQLRDVTGRNVRVATGDERTRVDIENVSAARGTVSDAEVRDLRAGQLEITDQPGGTGITARDVRAGRVDAGGAQIAGLEAPEVRIDVNDETVVYADQTRVARVQAGGAELANLNIAGVRLSVREGTVEGRTGDINAGNVTLQQGGRLEDVRLRSPVFTVEPSGRYRASADMTLGGGVIGNIPLGNARAQVNIRDGRLQLNELTADVAEGQLQGRAEIALDERGRSVIDAEFKGVDLSKALALQGGRMLPLEGQTTGRIDLAFQGTDLGTATGRVEADIVGTAGDEARGQIPVTGRVALTAENGLFTVEEGRLGTGQSELTATGRLDLRDERTELDLSLKSADAGEIEQLARVLGLGPEVQEQLDALQARLGGNVDFTGRVTGNIADPTITGRVAVDRLELRGRDVGRLETELDISPGGIDLRQGRLEDRAGGVLDFDVSVPAGGANNVRAQATLKDVEAGSLLSALPIELPGQLRDVTGRVSGKVDVQGLPRRAQGTIDITGTKGTIAGQPYDELRVGAALEGTRVDVQQADIRLGQGRLGAKGTYDYESGEFDLALEGDQVPLSLAAGLLPPGTNLPQLTGIADFTARARGDRDVPETFDVEFAGTAREAMVGEEAVGDVTFRGTTVDRVLQTEITANIGGTPQTVTASVNFGDRNVPFNLQYDLNQSPIGPFLSLVPQLRGLPISGTATGTIQLSGNLGTVGPGGEFTFTTENLTGTAQLSQLNLQVEDTQLAAAEPVVVRFDTNEIVFESARFVGGGSNLTISGTKALGDHGVNNLLIAGQIDLSLLNALPPSLVPGDLIYGGFADVAIRLTGTNANPSISGTADLDSAAVTAFLENDRLSLTSMDGRIIFSADQAQIENVTGLLGGGKFVASGGIVFGDSLNVDAFRINLVGNNVTVPFPTDFSTTGDANLEISGRRVNGQLATLVSGRINATRALYTQDIDLANIIGARREASLSAGAAPVGAPRLDLIIEGRDALVVRNNIADLNASVSLRVTGTTDDPLISGRVTVTGGTLLFRGDRYLIQRGVIVFPPNVESEPIVSLIAETEIAGYQVFVNLSGPLTDTGQLNVSVRSSPALPQADVVSLITTGNLANTQTGIPTLARTGITTAADILTDAIISDPARRATERLFGLNIFEIDPILSGERLDPSARLTVGRQINNNLRVTYSTNLSESREQVLAVSYAVSDRISFVAQYVQNPLGNATRARNSFNFEVRLRRRF